MKKTEMLILSILFTIKADLVKPDSTGATFFGIIFSIASVITLVAYLFSSDDKA